MAKGKIVYIASTNLEPIAQAITSMGQSASKKDKPEILGQKIKAISSDATGTEAEMLVGKTFYAGGNKKTGSMANRGAWTGRIGVNGKVSIPQGYHDGNGYVDQSIVSQGSYTNPLSSVGNNPAYIRIPQGAYFTNASSGYPEIIYPLSMARSSGYALQSELDSMTNDRNNWMNIANNRPIIDTYNYTLSTSTQYLDLSAKSVAYIYFDTYKSDGSFNKRYLGAVAVRDKTVTNTKAGFLAGYGPAYPVTCSTTGVAKWVDIKYGTDSSYMTFASVYLDTVSGGFTLGLQKPSGVNDRVIKATVVAI